MTIDEAIKRLDRNAYRTTCYGNRVVEHEENLIAIQALEKQIPKTQTHTLARNAVRNSQCMVIKQVGSITPKRLTEKRPRKK